MRQNFIPPSPPRVPDGSLVYAVGDIHGRADLLFRLLERLADDARHRKAKRVAVVFLGDYVDRGAESRQVVERLAAGPPATGPLAGADWICLKGNHEDAMMRFLEDPSAGVGWCMYGGLETVRSYAGAIPEQVERDLDGLQTLLAGSLPPDHARFLAHLPCSHEEGDYFFAHAGVRPGIPLSTQVPDDLMWIRDPFLWSAENHGRVVVHGHTIVPAPETRPNRIGIDTGAYRTGRLTALALEGADRRFMTA